MADKKKDKDYSRSLKKQNDIFMDTIVRMAGRSLEQALKDTFFRQRFINNQQRKFYVSLGDNPIAEMKLAELDRERALIDLREYEAMMNKVHDEVKKEAFKAAEEGVEEALKELNKSFK